MEGTFVIAKPYDLRLPKTVTNPVVFSSPHSGRDYSAEFVRKSILSKLHLRSSEDAFVDELFDGVVDFGSPFLAAKAPRAYVDLSRGPEEFDPSIIEGANTPYNNPRIASGLGVIPRVVSEGRQIQEGKISMTEALVRIRDVYHPYHNFLAELITQAKLRFGIALLIDCHSMPNDALQNAMAPGGQRPDIILGNRFGAAASAPVFEIVETAFMQQGFIVGRNTPFAGGHITQKYGSPSKGQHVVQVEINRSLYMNEDTITKNAHFDDIRTRLSKVSYGICTKLLPRLHVRQWNDYRKARPFRIALFPNRCLILSAARSTCSRLPASGSRRLPNEWASTTFDRLLIPTPINRKGALSNTDCKSGSACE